jgi:hypothetical protein
MMTKEEKKIYMKQYRIDNKDTIKECNKKYNSDPVNQEKRKEYMKVYHRWLYLNNKDSLRSVCKDYYLNHKEEARIYNQSYRLIHKDELKEKSKIYRGANKDKIKEINKKTKLNSRYDISIDEYNNILLKQQNKCYICKLELKKPCVDHDHNTEKVRGIICYKCNTGLGRFNDNINSIINAIEYLEQDNNSDALIKYSNKKEVKQFVNNIEKKKCKICNSKFTKQNKLCVDHNHKTGIVRGILCNSCNSGLGMFNENVTDMLTAIEYLKQSQEYSTDILQFPNKNSAATATLQSSSLQPIKAAQSQI